jgi:hypothetical protein
MSFGNAWSDQIRRIREVTQGVTPAGAMQILPFETWQVSGPISREQPGNVLASRQVADNPANNIKVSGSAKSDFTYSDYQGLNEECFCAAMQAPATLTATTISATTAPSLHNTAAGSWSIFSDGDLVLVSGFATNPAVFLARVSGAPTSSDLNCDSSFGAGGAAFQVEAAGSSITVQHAGRYRLGTTMLTASYEEWNTQSLVGKIHKGIGVSKFTLDVPYPNKCALSWTFEGISSKVISAQLVNTSTAWSGNPIINSNLNFGDAGVPTAGFGFRYGNQGASALQPTVRIKSLKLEIDNPLLPEGGAGTLGPIDVSPDKRFNVKLTLSLFRNGAAMTEQMLTDAENAAATLSVGWGFKGPDGHRQYIYLPYVQPANEKTTGVKDAGREMGDLEYVGRIDGGVTGMFQWSQFT